MATKFITVSIEIMHDKNLTQSQKFIIAEIEQLCSLEKGCFASNRHFSELIGISTMGVSKAINSLQEMGYITIDNAQTKRNFGRIITINSRKSAINYRKSDINCGLESKENKTFNKTFNKDATLLSVFFEENKPNEYDMGIAKWFVYYRRRIKKPVSTTAPIKMAVKQINICMNEGYTLDEIKEAMESREWQSLKLEWIQKEIVKEKEW